LHITPTEIGKEKVTTKRISLRFASLGNHLASKGDKSQIGV